MEPTDLARWTRFAMKGGIGKCVAVDDCVAENPDDLMFMKDDEIIVLLQVSGTGESDGVYLGYCEGVIGKFASTNVQFLTKLKKPIMAKRSSVASTRSTHSSSHSHSSSPYPPANSSSPYPYQAGNTHSNTNSPFPGSFGGGKSPTPPGTSAGIKSPTPTFDLANVRVDSRASSVASRWTKTPLESPVNATFSFNANTSSFPTTTAPYHQGGLSFSPPASGLREEQAVGHMGMERTSSGGGETGNGYGTGGTVPATSSFGGNRGSFSTSTSMLSTSASQPFVTPASSSNVFPSHIDSSSAPNRDSIPHAFSSIPPHFDSPSRPKPGLPFDSPSRAFSSLPPPHFDSPSRSKIGLPFGSPSHSNLGLPFDSPSRAFSSLPPSHFGSPSSNSNLGLPTDTSSMAYNPYRASTIQRQIELVQQETEDLHHAFMHSRDASLSSTYSGSSFNRAYSFGDRTRVRYGGLDGGDQYGELEHRMSRRKPPPSGLDVVGEDQGGENGNDAEAGLATSPLQIVKKSPSLRVVSPMSLGMGEAGRSVSFGSVGGRLGGLGEEEEEQEWGEGGRGGGMEGEGEGGGRDEPSEEFGSDRVLDLERELERELDGLGFGRDDSMEDEEDTARFDMDGSFGIEKALRELDERQPASQPSHSSHRHRPSLDIDVSLMSNTSSNLNIDVDGPSLSSTSAASSSGIPDSSYSASFAQRLSVQSDGSDGEVGIGLSLLANLMGGDDDDDDDSDYGDGESDASDYGREEAKGSGSGVRESRDSASMSEEETVEGLSYGADDDVVSLGGGDSTREKVDGDEDGDGEEDERKYGRLEKTPSTLDFPMPPTTFAGNLISRAHGPGSLNGSPPSHPSLAQSPPSHSTFGSPPSHSSTHQSPASYGSPPSHSMFGSPPSNSIHHSPTPAQRQAFPGGQKSPTNLTFPSQKSPTALAFPSQKSPTSPSFSVGSGSGSFGPASGSRYRNASNASLLDFAPPIVPRERAPSIATTGTNNSNGTWEGASDIYDNYRYSRFSMGGGSVRSVKTSLRGSVVGLFGGGDEESVPPVPERQGTRDSQGARESRDGDGDGDGDRDSGIRKRANSDASVYTQGSVDEIANAGVEGEMKRESVRQSKRDSNDSTNPSIPATQRRPAPLELKEGPGSETSPLLHATWGSPMSSHFNDPGMDTARPEFNLNDLRDFSAERGMGAVGMASAMRRRVEGEKSPIALTFASVLKGGIGVDVDVDEGPSVGSVDAEGTSGLGQGIVVEDEEELPSRFLGDERGSASPELDEEGNTTIGGHGEEDESDVVPTIELPPVSPAAPPLPPSSEDAPSPNAGDVPNANLDQYRHHLRPNLRDFREGGTITVPGTGERRSLFMPHPGAPKPLSAGLASPGAGPMYVQRQMQTPPPPGAPPPHAPPGAYPHHPQGPYPPQGGIQPGQIFMHPGLPPPRPRLHVIQVLRQALSQPPPAPRPMINGRAPPPPRGPTIYGRLEVDLAGSLGPVPVLWSLDAPPTKVIQKALVPQQTQQQLPPLGVQIQGQAQVAPSPLAGGRGQTPPPSMVGGDPTSARSSSASLGRMSSASAPGIGVGVPGSPSKRPSVLSSREDMTRSTSPLSQSDLVGDRSRLSSSSSGGGTPTPTPAGVGGGVGQTGEAPKLIPRANFFPKAAGMRPRSRSFSDLKSVGNGAGSGLRASLSGGGEIKKSPSLTGSSANSTSSSTSNSSLTPPTAKPVKSSPLRPSPLSLSQNVVSLPASKSPLAQSMMIPARSESPSSTVPLSPSTSSFQSNLGNGPNSSVMGLRKLASRSTLTKRTSSNDSIPPLSSISISRPIPMSRSTLPPPSTASLSPTPSSLLDAGSTSSLGMLGGMGTSPSSVSSMPTRLGSIDDVKEKEMVETRSMSTVSPPSTGSTIPNSATSTLSSAAGSGGGSGMGRSNSLRAKLSLPNLRRNRSRQDEPPTSPIDGVHPDMLFQVQDMEFELVRPNFNQFGAARSSEDSAVLGRDGLAPLDTNVSATGPGTATSPNAFLRPESPTMSINSLVRSPTTETNHSWSQAGPSSNLASSPISAPSPRSPAPESESQMEAHRNRELKWMNLLSTSQPSQARKSKKIRKLLLEGVPASVRYMVWSHLTDGKARFVPGVYPQLCKRGRVPASEVIEREVARGGWFAREEQGQLRVLSDAGGGVVQLLQAYLNMVPDIQYTPGLPHIVGQLLLLAPEEDAFWIFISIMDTHIRPYFSSGSIQIEVDSALFSRALEVNDAQVAKKLLVDMGINPNAICHPWFTSLFVGCLPAEYLTKTWDMFLYDGIPFLLRVGLAIVAFVRRQILECTSEEAALSLLHRPPPVTLPPSPENYLSFVYSIRLKDDDVKKQRIKMEAQVKRQTQQQPRAANPTGSISLPRA